jgi:hypothetical protein
MRRALVQMFGPAVLISVMTVPCFAQQTKGEIAGGWQYLTGRAIDPVLNEVSTSKGFFVEGAGSVTPMFSVVGEYSDSSQDIAISVNFLLPTGIVAATNHMSVRTFMGGIRIGAPAARVVRPFAQVLFGGVHSAATFSFASAGLAVEGLVGTSFGYDFAGGVDFKISGHLAGRAKATLLRVNQYTDDNVFRLQAGLVIPF